MTSSVKPRQNHYETLGLSPTASQQEISGAFAKMMGMFGARSPSAFVDLVAAFEVLRDATKRRAYDRALGISAPDTSQWKVTWAARSNPAYLISATSQLTGQTAGEPLRRTSAKDEWQPQSAGQSGQKATSSISSSTGKPGTRESFPQASEKAELTSGRHERPSGSISGENRGVWDRGAFSDKPLPDGEEAALDLKRSALVLGGLIGAAALIGAFAGTSVKEDEEPLLSEGPVTAVHATKSTHRGTLSLSPTVREPNAVAIPAATADLEKPQAFRAQTLAPRMKRVAFSERSRSLEEQQSNEAQPATTDIEEDQRSSDGEPTTGQPMAALPIPADLPLPHQVIARTIARIGYSCGSVVSAAAAAGAAPGVYTVTCSSGQTYEARQVQGHYRFRRPTELK